MALVYYLSFKSCEELVLCALASLSGLPAVSLPFAEPDALPLGIQLIGKKFADVELLCMAAALFERSEDEIR